MLRQKPHSVPHCADGCPSILGRDGEMNQSSKSVNLLLLIFTCGRTLLPAAGPRLEVYCGRQALETRRPLPSRPARFAAPLPARPKGAQAKAEGLGRHAREAPRPNSRPVRMAPRAVRGCAAGKSLRGLGGAPRRDRKWEWGGTRRRLGGNHRGKPTEDT